MITFLKCCFSEKNEAGTVGAKFFSDMTKTLDGFCC